MRLLDVNTLELHTFYGDAIPRYAILSHNWLQDHEEVTFQQIQDSDECRNKLGFRKIELLCKQARLDDYQYAWIDTCCIDKANYSELSEAINSMFAWYRQAGVCYAYLTDIDEDVRNDYLASRWWTRAWTLQELLAPDEVVFFDRDWRRIGEKCDLASEIANKTGISVEVLTYPLVMFDISVAQRMSWAANRESTRAEDLGYSLLGIFRINMPMQYGEGEGAFIRLQKEILKNSNDQTLFAWCPTTDFIEDMAEERDVDNTLNPMLIARSYGCTYGMFAPHPTSFKDCGSIWFLHHHAPNCQIADVNGALHMEMPLFRLTTTYPSKFWIGLLPCATTHNLDCMIGILLESWGKGNRFKRIQVNRTYSTFLVRCSAVRSARIEDLWIDDAWRAGQRFDKRLTSLQRSIVIHSDTQTEALHLVSYPEGAGWHMHDSTLHLQEVSSDGTSMALIGLKIVPTHSAPVLHVDVTIKTSTSHDKSQAQVVLSWAGNNADGLEQRVRFADWTSFRASVINPLAKVEAEVKTFRIFNHLITHLTITARRFLQ